MSHMLPHENKWLRLRRTEFILPLKRGMRLWCVYPIASSYPSTVAYKSDHTVKCCSTQVLQVDTTIVQSHQLSLQNFTTAVSCFCTEFFSLRFYTICVYFSQTGAWHWPLCKKCTDKFSFEYFMLVSSLFWHSIIIIINNMVFYFIFQCYYSFLGLIFSRVCCLFTSM